MTTRKPMREPCHYCGHVPTDDEPYSREVVWAWVQGNDGEAEKDCFPVCKFGCQGQPTYLDDDENTYPDGEPQP